MMPNINGPPTPSLQTNTGGSSSSSSSSNTTQYHTSASNGATRHSNRNSKNSKNNNINQKSKLNTKSDKNIPAHAQSNNQSSKPSSRSAKRPPLTHFLCIPLLTSESRPQLEESLRELQREVASVNAAHLEMGRSAALSLSLSLSRDVAHMDDGDSSSNRGNSNNNNSNSNSNSNNKEKNNDSNSNNNHVRASDLPCWIPADAIRPLGTLHLTLGVMSLGLETPERLERAIATLQSLDLRRILQDLRDLRDLREAGQRGQAADTKLVDDDDAMFAITLQSLQAMRSAKATSVLYAHPHDSTSMLLPFCEAVRNVFWEAGLLVGGGGGGGGNGRPRPLRLHATIVNTVYARGTVPELVPAAAAAAAGIVDEGNAKRKRKATGMNLDARGWVQRYNGHVWAKDVPVKKIAICRMAAERVEGEDGARYKEIAAVSFKSG